jgi:hypothetical protein
VRQNRVRVQEWPISFGCSGERGGLRFAPPAEIGGSPVRSHSLGWRQSLWISDRDNQRLAAELDLPASDLIPNRERMPQDHDSWSPPAPGAQAAPRTAEAQLCPPGFSDNAPAPHTWTTKEASDVNRWLLCYYGVARPNSATRRALSLVARSASTV